MIAGPNQLKKWRHIFLVGVEPTAAIVETRVSVTRRIRACGKPVEEHSSQPGFAIDFQLQDSVSRSKANFDVVVLMNYATIDKTSDERFLHAFPRATRTRGGANTARTALGENLSRQRAPSIVRACTRFASRHPALALQMVIFCLRPFA